MKLINGHIRPNGDETNAGLFGWMECLDGDSGVWFNNIKVKIKRGENSIKVILDFPSKIAIMQDKTEKKIFFVKPVTAKAYKEFEMLAISLIKTALEAKNGDKSGL